MERTHHFNTSQEEFFVLYDAFVILTMAVAVLTAAERMVCE
jgi:hypothetical protein